MTLMTTALMLNMPVMVAANANLSTPVALLALSAEGADASDLTGAIYQGSVIENAIAQLLGPELKRESVNAADLLGMTERLTATIRDHLPTLSAALSPREHRRVRKIAADSAIDEQIAMIEYLANASLMRALRDYHELPARDVFLKDDRRGGFITLTKNGSMVSSGPHAFPCRNRTLHYVRMPSRTISMSQSETRRGQLEDDIRIVHGLRSTAFNTSAVSMLLYVTPDKAAEFEQLREWAETGLSSVHYTVSQIVKR